MTTKQETASYRYIATPFNIPDDLITVYDWLLALNRENHNPNNPITEEMVAIHFDQVVRKYRAHKEHLPKLPKGRTARDLSNWTYCAMERLYDKYPTICDAAEVYRTRQVVASLVMRTTSPLAGTKKPLTDNEMIIFAKLRSLPPEKGMKTDEILDWLSTEHGQNIDEKTLRDRLEALYPFGLDNRHGAGYYIKR